MVSEQSTVGEALYVGDWKLDKGGKDAKDAKNAKNARFL